MSRVAAALRRALAPYQDREQRPLARPEGARPVALISRLFPLLPDAADLPDATGTKDAEDGTNEANGD